MKISTLLTELNRLKAEQGNGATCVYAGGRLATLAFLPYFEQPGSQGRVLHVIVTEGADCADDLRLKEAIGELKKLRTRHGDLECFWFDSATMTAHPLSLVTGTGGVVRFQSASRQPAG